MAMNGFDLDEFVSLEELIRRTREILWKMPSARRFIQALEAEAAQDGETYVSMFEYLLEVVAEVFMPAVEEDDDKDVIRSFLGICEELLSMNSSLLRESVDDLVAKLLIRDYPHLISQSGLQLQKLIATH
ncbi:hypothetical protein ACFPOI_51035 [Nonomuraea angiospora]|uniref:Immunity protein 30 domain-containing protein n=1 Tax=Nonomuraea angiospora TaxID=46172 RepID=A0ABR9M1C8_9ACTN|nr:hypothetical protein [Nonomuraea angiospora]MBE1586696.1 hypothetical protein [Nonomuraea angiospora]